MFTNTPSDRVQLVGVGELAHPGSCMICGSGVCEDGYVNLGVYFEYEGQMYLCVTCVIQVSEVIGCLIPSEANTLRELAASVQKTNVDLQRKLDASNERLNAFELALAGIDLPSRLSGGSDSLFSEDKSPSSEAVAGASVGATGGEPVAAKPVTVKRRGNTSGSSVRDTPERDNILDL